MQAPFRTTDVDLAALLVCRQQHLLAVEAPSSPPWLAEFVFDGSDALERVVRVWEDSGDDCAVDARAFAKARIRLYRRARNALDAAKPGHRELGRMR
jgi:hypothetical protein